MSTSRTFSILLAISVAALLGGCGGGSTATQSAGVTTTISSTSSATTTSSTVTSTTQTSGAKTSSTTTTSSRPSNTSSTPARGTAAPPKPSKPVFGRLALASAAFPHGGKIPVRYTCDGANVSPPLQWGKVPSGTAQMFLLALSLTSGAQGAIRWAVGGIKPSSGGFAAGQLPPGAVVGRGTEGHTGWAGICPSRGKTQSVIVLVYALRHKLNLASGFDPRAVQRQFAGNTMGTGVVFGAYKRP